MTRKEYFRDLRARTNWRIILRSQRVTPEVEAEERLREAALSSYERQLDCLDRIIRDVDPEAEPKLLYPLKRDRDDVQRSYEYLMHKYPLVVHITPHPND